MGILTWEPQGALPEAAGFFVFVFVFFFCIGLFFRLLMDLTLFEWPPYVKYKEKTNKQANSLKNECAFILEKHFHHQTNPFKRCC